MSKTEPRHGTIIGYRTDGCRCRHCTAAKKHYERKRRAAYLASGNMTHGLRSTWDAGCRCEECRTCHRQAATVYLATEAARYNHNLKRRRRHQRNRGTDTVTCHGCSTQVGLGRDGRIGRHHVGFYECSAVGYMPRAAA